MNDNEKVLGVCRCCYLSVITRDDDLNFHRHSVNKKTILSTDVGEEVSGYNVNNQFVTLKDIVFVYIYIYIYFYHNRCVFIYCWNNSFNWKKGILLSYRKMGSNDPLKARKNQIF